MRIACTLLLLFTVNVSSQTLSHSVILAGGGNAEGGSVSLSYSIGEPIVETFSANDHLLTQGFQQDASIILAIAATSLPDAGLIDVYPNPARDQLFAEIADAEPVQVRLLDLLGRERAQLYVDRFSSPRRLEIPIGGLPSGSYVLHVRYQDPGKSIVKLIIIKP